MEPCLVTGQVVVWPMHTWMRRCVESFPHCKYFLLAGDTDVGRAQWKKMEPERFVRAL